jgi:predicted CopG family antitoxin
MELISTIAISHGTRHMLKELGHKGQTYDELIQDLIERKRMKKETGFA